MMRNFFKTICFPSIDFHVYKFCFELSLKIKINPSIDNADIIFFIKLEYFIRFQHYSYKTNTSSF